MSKRWLPTWRGEITMSPHPEIKGSGSVEVSCGSDCDLIIMVNTMITELARRRIKDKTLTAASDYLNRLLTEKQTGKRRKTSAVKKDRVQKERSHEDSHRV